MSDDTGRLARRRGWWLFPVLVCGVLTLPALVFVAVVLAKALGWWP